MERLWSYLRRFAKSTKEMRPSHRIDVLTSALLHFASRVRLNLGLFFVRATLILALSTSWYAPMYALHKGKKSANSCIRRGIVSQKAEERPKHST